MGAGTPPKEEDRRYSRRRAVRCPLTFRILHDARRLELMRLSGPAEAEIRDLGPEGIGVATEQIIVDGLHIGRVTDQHPAPRVFIQCELPGGHWLRAVCRTVWCEQVAGQRLYQVGLRFCEVGAADRAALDGLLLPSR